MTAASVQEVDAFIRMQKEKLGRDRIQNPYYQVKSLLNESFKSTFNQS